MARLSLQQVGPARKQSTSEHLNKITPICRFYRAPELLLGARDYGVTVDVWSLGCVLAEMALLRPLLEGEDTGDQLAVIVELLGPPSEAELAGMGAEDSVLASAVQLMQVGGSSLVSP